MTGRPFSAAMAVVLLGASARGAEKGPGTTSAEFLRIMPSVRAVAMGEAGAGLADDHLGALSLNIAGLGLVRNRELSFSHNEWLESIRLEHLGYAHPLGERGTAVAAGTLLTTDKIPSYDNFALRQDDIRVSDLSLRAGYGWRVTGDPDDRRLGLFAGAGGRYLSETLAGVRAQTQGFDAGLLWRGTAGPGMAGIGASLEALGPGLKYDGDTSPLPATARLGAAWTVPVHEDPLSLVADYRVPYNHAGTFGAGVEYSVRRLMSWRLGWTSGQDVGRGIRFGAGFNLRLLRIDYALTSFGSFGVTHRIAAWVRFGEPTVTSALPAPDDPQDLVQEHIRRGDELMRGRRMLEAALEYNEALKLNPLNTEALRKLKRVREWLEIQK